MTEPTEPTKIAQEIGATLKRAIDHEPPPTPPSEPTDSDFHPPGGAADED